MFNDYPDVVVVHDLIIMLKIGKNTAYKLLKDNKIASIRIGKNIKIPKINIINYLKLTQ